MIIAGIGCRRGALASEIEAAVAGALVSSGIARERLDALATHATKQDEPGILALAERWALKLLCFTTSEMQGVTSEVETVSERVVQLKGVPSVAEAAALTGAGLDARLLAPRVTTEQAACAIAEGKGPLPVGKASFPQEPLP
ncbi:MAG: cobalamin biosynthesis protein [Hyphomicrobium sp.]|jgi:cobalt-precorrin 5A hydrolase